MPPKKKHKTAQPTTSKPSSTRSTRSRSASNAPPTTTTKGKKRTVKSEPQDPDLTLDDKDIEYLQAWDGTQQPRVECWVEIPAPKYRSREDELMFVRPRNKAALRAKGKHKEDEDSFVWHVEQRPVDADPFHFAQEDLDRGSGVDAKRVVAIKPKAKSQPLSKTQLHKDRRRSASAQPSQPPSSTEQEAPQVTAEASTSRPQSPTVLEPEEAQSHVEMEVEEAADNDQLEDLFLGSTKGARQKVSDPLFFDGGASDEEDRLRNATPVQTMGSQRQKIKRSPTLGDRIAKPCSTSALAEEQRKKERKEKRKLQQLELEEKEKKRKKDTKLKTQPVETESEDDGKGVEDVKNLRSELNEDAFARSTGVRHKEEYRNKLAKFAQARKKARLERGDSVSSSEEEGPRFGKRVESGSSGSSSSSSSGSGSGSGSSSDSQDFIVADDQIEYDDGFHPPPSSLSLAPKASSRVSASQPNRNTDKRKSRWDRDNNGRIHLVPLSEFTSESSTSASVLAAHGLSGVGSRKGIDELCLDWLEWAVARVLVTWSALSSGDRERLERARAALKSKMRSIEESVGSVAMRRQFKWYLTQYPKIELEGLFSDELEQFGTLAKQGCGVCHRRSQKPAFKVTFGGSRYDQVKLAPLKRDFPSSPSSASDSDSSDDQDDSDSDRSSETETWREESTDLRGRPSYTFYAGHHCAHRAAVLHKLHHWEWTTMQTLAKHDSIRFVRRLMWRKGKDGRGKDGKFGAGAWEVAFCVKEMISPSGKCNWKGMKKGKTDGRELEKLRKRLKTLQGMAIEVNRAR